MTPSNKMAVDTAALLPCRMHKKKSTRQLERDIAHALIRGSTHHASRSASEFEWVMATDAILEDRPELAADLVNQLREKYGASLVEPRLFTATLKSAPANVRKKFQRLTGVIGDVPAARKPSGYAEKATQTLKQIAGLLPRPDRGPKTIHVEMQDQVRRGSGSKDSIFHMDWLVNLATKKVTALHGPPASSGIRAWEHEIPFGHALVTREESPIGSFNIIATRIYLPTIDQGTLDVAVDAILAGSSEKIVRDTIGQAIGGRGGLTRDAYVALATRIAEARSKRKRA